MHLCYRGAIERHTLQIYASMTPENRNSMFLFGKKCILRDSLVVLNRRLAEYPKYPTLLRLKEVAKEYTPKKRNCYLKSSYFAIFRVYVDNPENKKTFKSLLFTAEHIQVWTQIGTILLKGYLTFSLCDYVL